MLKDMLLSKRVWGVILTFVALILAHFKIAFDSDTQARVAEGIIPIVGMAWTLVTAIMDKRTKDGSASGSGSISAVSLVLIALFVLTFSGAAQAQSEPSYPTNVYAAGVSYNAGGSPAIAGTGLYARKISDSGTYAFTVVDALPASVKPFTVSTNFGAGVAQKAVTIAGVPIFIPTSAGLSYTGNNTGWQWTTGAMAVFKVKENWRLMPSVRLVKSSVSNGAGYQPVVGVLFGWGQ